MNCYKVKVKTTSLLNDTFHIKKDKNDEIGELYFILYDNIINLRKELIKANYISDSIRDKLDFELAQLTNKIWDDIKVEFKINE